MKMILILYFKIYFYINIFEWLFIEHKWIIVLFWTSIVEVFVSIPWAFYPMLVGLYPVWGPPHTFIRFLNKINNLNDLFSHKICCSINVQYNVYIFFLPLYILGTVNSTCLAFNPIVPYTLCVGLYCLSLWTRSANQQTLNTLANLIYCWVGQGK